MLLTRVTHAVVAFTALSIPIAVFDGSLFSWHPTFMAIGFLGLMSEGVLTSISFRNLEGNDRLRKIWVHFAWQASAVVSIMAGFWAIYRNKVIHDKPHFQTVHGKFGITTFTLALMAALGGTLSFRKFGLLAKLPEGLQSRTKWLHRSSGLIVWLLSLVTVELALTHKAVWKGWLNHIWQVAIVVLGIAVLMSWEKLEDGRGQYERQADHERELT